MDPNQTLIELLESLAERDIIAASESFAILTRWLENGGFVPPALPALIDALKLSKALGT